MGLPCFSIVKFLGSSPYCDSQSKVSISRSNDANVAFTHKLLLLFSMFGKKEFPFEFEKTPEKYEKEQLVASALHKERTERVPTIVCHICHY